MKIKDLVGALPPDLLLLKEPLSELMLQRRVQSICDDSRMAETDTVFVALRGARYDSHRDLEKVCQHNPSALVVEDLSAVPSFFRGAVLPVRNTRLALALLSSRFFGDPSAHLFCFGVTGTNGKTSCTYLMEHLLTKFGLPTGVIGTVEHRLGETRWPTESTTPGAKLLQSRLSEMRNAGARAVAMEVSSHALDQFRADAIHFNSVLFTNLTLDHLDYHQSMQKYFEAKQRLFTDLLWQSKKAPMLAAINGDDPWGRKLKVAGNTELLTFGKSSEVDFRFEIEGLDFSSTRFRLFTRLGEFKADLPLCGEHNVSNAVGCLISMLALGTPPDASLRALRDFPGVPGRLQLIPNNRGVHVMVDYAHSPDALENVLLALRLVREQSGSQNKIHLVFGCGGDRDKSKRPLMAQIAEKWADRVIVTSDNPRTEDPQQILQDIRKGFAHPENHLFLVDRREAIQKVLQTTPSGDVVLIAGKGHEDYQILGTEKIHLSDVEVAREFLQ